MPVQSDQAKAKRIFLEALEIDAPTTRGVFLDKACAGDADLRRRVEALIAAHQISDGLLDRPAVDVTEFAPDDAEPLISLAEPAGAVIGPYTLIEPIGEGGMGIVYMAEQTRPVRRKVALKVIKPGMDTRQVVARFDAERQALAMMDHPHIARVFDAGATAQGRPYFVMELVRGIPITEYCDRERLDVSARLRLFALVCQAVQHAHQKGVIHRDLKPSNMLVAVIDGRAVPKIIDFGVAKAMSGRLTERTLHTGFHQFVGTPLYMSPEQAALSGADTDTRSDVYSLGVLLYELLAGSTPIDRDLVRESSHDDVRRTIREVDPPKPSSRLGASGARLAAIAADRRTLPRVLRRSVRGELDWVVMKALEKDRARRYQTAWALAADVTRFLEGRPLEAGPPSARYRFKKYARRNKALLTTASLVAASLIAGTALSAWQAIRATRAESRTAAALNEVNGQRILAERHLQASLLQQARQAIDLNRLDRAREILDGPLAVNEGDRSHDFARGYLRRFFPVEERIGDPIGYDSFILSPDGRDLAINTGDREIVLWDLAAGRPRIRLEKHRLAITSVAFSRDGSRLASAAVDGAHAGGEARIWDARSGRMLTEIVLQAPIRLWSVQFTADPRSLLLIVDDGVELPLRSIHYDLGPDPLHPTPAQGRTTPAVHGLGHLPAFHGVPTPDGDMISDFGQGRLAKYDPASGKEAWSFQTKARADLRYAASPEGQFLVAVIDRRDVIVVNTVDGAVRNRFELEKEATWIYAVLVGPRAERSVVVDDRGACVFNARRRRRRYRIDLKTPGWTEQGFSAALSPDAERLSLTWHGMPGGQEPIRIYDLATGKDLATYTRRLDCLVTKSGFAADGRSVFFTQCGSIVRWYFDRSGAGAQPQGHADEAWAVAFSPDGKVLASGSDNTKPIETIKLWDPVTAGRTKGWRGPRGTVSSLAFSPDGKVLASASIHPTVNLHLWDTATGALAATLEGHTDRVRAVAFSPDGKALASAGSDRTVRLWNTGNHRPIAILTGHSDTVRGVAFSTDGLSLASASNDNTVRLWNVRNGESVRSFRGPRKFVAVAFSPDGTSLAAADQEGSVTLWDPATGDRRLAIHGNDPQLLAMAFSPDGQTVATAGVGRSIRLWDSITGQELIRLDGHKAQINGLAFSPDGETLASCGHDGEVKLWRSKTQ